jgi:pyridinium-3,5-biscarboxylic acid mononucleotide sulfurtransferase
MSEPGTLDALRDVIAATQKLVVAFSGGVDSALVAWVARDVLGREASLAVTAVSPSLAPSELSDCRSMAKEWDLRWMEVATDEGSRPEYVANGTDRCYHCKSELMDRIVPLAIAEQAVVALGVNVDDLSDHRPGQRAASERGAVFPLVQAGFSKAAVRSVARDLGLRAWDKPAGACLASRVPYGTPVTFSTLNRVASAEEGLRALGFRELRVRHYGDVARLEFGRAEIASAFAAREAVVKAVKEAGYKYVTLDLEGFRSGNLNDGAVSG